MNEAGRRHPWRTRATRGELAAALSADIAARLARAVRERGVAGLAVSGGATPAALFDALSACPLPWSQVRIALVDERWVDAGHADSNERLVRERLVRGSAAAAGFIGWKTPHDSPEEGLPAARARLAAFGAPLDCVALGMGADGHTASWFPGADGLAAATRESGATRLVVARPPAGGHPRVTLTLSALLDSRAIALHITGADKRRTLERADADPGLPVHHVLRQRRVPVTVYWAP